MLRGLPVGFLIRLLRGRLRNRDRTRLRIIFGLVTVIFLGYLVPERGILPVAGATVDSWDPNSFWFEPWGVSGVHKGIDIFAPRHTPVLSAVSGVVTFSGSNPLGGNVVLVLGPRWRLHYYAHLDHTNVRAMQPVRRGQQLGTVGDSGNARGKPTHLHYVIRTPFPIPWRYQRGISQGWKQMFYLDPAERFRAWGVIS